MASVAALGLLARLPGRKTEQEAVAGQGRADGNRVANSVIACAEVGDLCRRLGKLDQAVESLSRQHKSSLVDHMRR